MLDFRHAGVRCREHTGLPDTPGNRRRLERVLQRIDAEQLLGNFDYAQHFPNGSQIERFRDHARRREEAEAALSGEALPRFSEFAEQWYRENQVRWRASHARTVRAVLDLHLVPTFGQSRLNEITRAAVLGFRSELAVRKGRRGGTLSPGWINHIITPLRMILEEGADRYEFTSPASRITALPVPRTMAEPFTLTEIAQILAAVRLDFKNYYTVRFLTGLRSCEIDGLQWRHVDFERRQLLVRQSLVRGVLGPVKTDGSYREVDLAGAAIEALRAQYEVAGHHEFVFCNSVGQPLDQMNVTKRVWYPLLRLVGLRKRNPYQTRHTAASIWLAAGENPEWVARQLGHTSTEMLFRVYSRFVPNVTRRDGSAFEALVDKHLNVAKGDAHEDTDPD